MSNLSKPAVISLETLPQLFAYHRSRFGGWRMEAQESSDTASGGDSASAPPPTQPDGVSEEEWKALGDPGKAALVRERQRAEAAERALAKATKGATATPADMKKQVEKTTTGDGETPDVAELIQQAVDAAVAPLLEQEKQRQAEAAAEKIREYVVEAAKPLLHDPTDAVAHIDLTTVVDENGAADQQKIEAALGELTKAKPHLMKPMVRHAHGIGGAPGGVSTMTEADRVKAVLSTMNQTTGVREDVAAGQ